MLNGIKVIKLYAWEQPYERLISQVRLAISICCPNILNCQVREKELAVLKNAANLNALEMFMWSCAPFFVSLVAFVIYTAWMGNELTAENVRSIIASTKHLLFA